MTTFYTLRRVSDLRHTGGSHITTNPLHAMLKDDKQYKYLNYVEIPKIMESIIEILERQTSEQSRV